MATSHHTFPGDIDVRKAELLFYGAQQTLNIIPNIISFTVVENILAPTVLVTIQFADTLGIRNHMAISGGEELFLSWKTPAMGEYNNFHGILYTLDNRKVETNVETFTMSFVSMEKYRNDTTTLSKYYNGTHTNIAKKVWADGMPKEQPALEVIDSSNINTGLVVPNWRPMYTIQWLLSRCSDPIDLLFFQTIDGHTIRSLTQMFRGPVAFEYKRDINPQTANDKFFSVSNPPENLTEPFFQDMISGALASRTIEHDVLHKSFSTFDYQYQNQFDPETKLNRFPVYPNSLQPSSATALNYLAETRPFDGIYDPIAKTAPRRLSEFSILMHRRIQINVPGNSELRCGQIINYHPQSIEPPTNNQAKDFRSSGRWLITGIQHHLNIHRYSCVLELARDSQPNRTADSKVLIIDKNRKSAVETNKAIP